MFQCTKHYFPYQTIADPRWMSFWYTIYCTCFLSFPVDVDKTLWNQLAAVPFFTTDRCCWLFWFPAVATSAIQPNCSDSFPPSWQRTQRHPLPRVSLSWTLMLLTHKSSAAFPFIPELCQAPLCCHLNSLFHRGSLQIGPWRVSGLVRVCWLQCFMTCKCVG